MKKALILLACAAFSVSAFAQHKPLKKVKAATTVQCAVMPAHKVNIAEAAKKGNFADYNGKRYYMCCEGCAPAFKKDPTKYAKNSVGQPIPKAKKTGK